MENTIKNRIIKMKIVLSAALVMIIVLFLVLNLVTPDRTVSERENRELAQLPKITLSSVLDGSYFHSLDSYISDQFVFRDYWISLKSTAEIWQGRKEISNIYLGSSDYLLAKPELPNHQAVKQTITSINTFVKNHKKNKVSVMIVPNASQILKDQLPDFAAVHNQLKDINDIKNQLKGINYLDATSILQKHKKEDIYYHTDHHWTTDGAYDVYQGVSKQLGLNNSKDHYKRYLVSDSFEGTLASQSGVHTTKDKIYVYVNSSKYQYYVNYPDQNKKSASCFEVEALKKSDQYQVFFGGNHPLVEIRTTNHNGKNLMVFKDSYANSFIPFMISHYEKIILVDPRYYYDNLSSAIKDYGINEYLFLYSANTLVKDTVLKDVLNS